MAPRYAAACSSSESRLAFEKGEADVSTRFPFARMVLHLPALIFPSIIQQGRLHEVSSYGGYGATTSYGAGYGSMYGGARSPGSAELDTVDSANAACVVADSASPHYIGMITK